NRDLMKWLQDIGISTFTGSSGRVFPSGQIKPVEALNLLLEAVRRNGVRFNFRHVWKGWAGESLLMQCGKEDLEVKADSVVFALGGGSWPVTGSQGEWRSYFGEKGIATK